MRQTKKKTIVKSTPIKHSKREQLAIDKREERDMIQNARSAKMRKLFIRLFGFRKHTSIPKKRRKPPRGQPLPPPEHYTSWVEYAVFNTHLGTIYDDAICGLYPWDVTREDLDKALLNEYLALCEAAGVEISEESRERLAKRFS